MEEPNFYLDLTEAKSAHALDLLMGTRGYRRFDWVAVLRPPLPASAWRDGRRDGAHARHARRRAMPMARPMAAPAADARATAAVQAASGSRTRAPPRAEFKKRSGRCASATAQGRIARADVAQKARAAVAGCQREAPMQIADDKDFGARRGEDARGDAGAAGLGAGARVSGAGFHIPTTPVRATTIARRCSGRRR